jgi:hypothetical protein
MGMFLHKPLVGFGAILLELFQRLLTPLALPRHDLLIASGILFAQLLKALFHARSPFGLAPLKGFRLMFSHPSVCSISPIAEISLHPLVSLRIGLFKMDHLLVEFCLPFSDDPMKFLRILLFQPP